MQQQEGEKNMALVNAKEIQEARNNEKNGVVPVSYTHLSLFLMYH